jgi:hypothetical protein
VSIVRTDPYLLLESHCFGCIFLSALLPSCFRCRIDGRLFMRPQRDWQRGGRLVWRVEVIRSVPLIERDRALELRSTPARHPGPDRHKAPPAQAIPNDQLSAPAFQFPTPRATGRAE